jgi:transposase
MARFQRVLQLPLTDKERHTLIRITGSLKLPAIRILRANILLAYADETPVPEIRSLLNVSASMVHDTVAKALKLGVLKALEDLPRSGKPGKITSDARVWVVDLACQKPKDLGYPHEVWTQRLLTQHVRDHCSEAGHPCLSGIVSSTVHNILAKREIKPHKIEYYLERRDPEFESKKAQVLYVYKQVELYRQVGMPNDVCAIVSYDEKPGMQAIANTAPDLAPVPGKHPYISRDHEYKRLGTVTLLAGLDLMDGTVHGIVRNRHRTLEFKEFLEMLDQRYPKNARIRIVLDNHSAHKSAELQKYLQAKPDRFEFVFTPKHGSWLNIVETFFAKMTNSVLRGIRVKSKQELIERIEKYIAMINADPVIFRWTYKMDEVVL